MTIVMATLRFLKDIKAIFDKPLYKDVIQEAGGSTPKGFLTPF